MRGHTLMEMAFVLTLAGVTAASLVPSARRYVDLASVMAGREAVVGLLAEARAGGIETGRGSVRLTIAPAVATVVIDGVTTDRVDLTEAYGVHLALGGAGDSAEIAYDALGLGRVASRTIVLRRGTATSELVVSSYGRLRRR